MKNMVISPAFLLLQLEGGGSWIANCKGGGVRRKGSGGSVISPSAENQFLFRRKKNIYFVENILSTKQIIYFDEKTSLKFLPGFT